MFCLGLPEKVTSEQRPEQEEGAEEAGLAGDSTFQADGTAGAKALKTGV